ncbi:cytidylyltransferase domain-containing protein [Prochlorococcus marinus]|uniref:acylneuraminate cytidylyltransferase family protein n=1 Tax=Prochlorococcus marinus TaxID=1219 RepID=UPI001ADABCDF|nr:acylneuraminate cytidylyltransferase family protein [Prochlorococcus marinus]MBO8217696.1 acylneuraminate cytidylyltransferase family protein [Prochlorococcus marinus XMU1405]MBW3040859.1 hypothetical protein [Prochlorococcus marinus str. MU1405]MBW3048319.1 hypothetical protein [Prochlorococcus marinus str. MU1406]
MNKYIYLIPARAGSKRIPNKNIKTLNSKPLLVHSIDFAKNFISSENIFVLTDSSKAAEISKKESAIVYFRPKEYSRDDTSMLETVLDFLSSKNIDEDLHIVLLQPTSPFRSINYFRNLLEIYENNPEASSAVSLLKCTFFHPTKIGRLQNDINFVPIMNHNSDNVDNNKRESFFVISGTFYITSIKNLKLNNSFIGQNPIGLEESSNRFCNIDEPIDFEIAKKLAKNEKCVVL